MLSSQPGDEAYQTYAFEETELDATIKSTATLNIDILLEGETGTGKDTLAERLHFLSGRQGDYIAINCAAIPESLASSNGGSGTASSGIPAGRISAMSLVRFNCSHI